VAGKYTFEKLRNDATGKLQKEIEHKRTAVATFMEDNSASPALIILKELSEAMPKDLKLDVTLYQYTSSNSTLVLRGETDSYDAVAKIIEAIRKVSSLSQVEEKASNAKPGSDNKVIEFTVNAKYSGSTKPAPKA
jgi:hypothetical protein